MKPATTKAYLAILSFSLIAGTIVLHIVTRLVDLKINPSTEQQLIWWDNATPRDIAMEQGIIEGTFFGLVISILLILSTIFPKKNTDKIKQTFFHIGRLLLLILAFWTVGGLTGLLLRDKIAYHVTHGAIGRTTNIIDIGQFAWNYGADIGRALGDYIAIILVSFPILKSIIFSKFRLAR